MTKSLACLSLATTLVACTTSSLPPGGSDGAPPADFATGTPDLRLSLAPDLAQAGNDLGLSCGQGSAWIEENGMVARSPLVDSHFLALNCCDGAAVTFQSMQISSMVVVSWRHQVGRGPTCR